MPSHRHSHHHKSKSDKKSHKGKSQKSTNSGTSTSHPHPAPEPFTARFRKLFVKNELLSEGTSIFSGVVGARKIVPLELGHHNSTSVAPSVPGSRMSPIPRAPVPKTRASPLPKGRTPQAPPRDLPEIDLDSDAIRVKGQAYSYRVYGLADAVIAGTIATIELDILSGLFHYIEMSEFLDEKKVPIVTEVVAVLPARGDQPQGYYAHVLRRQHDIEANVIGLRVKTSDTLPVQLLVGNTFSTELTTVADVVTSELHLRALNAVDAYRTVLSVDDVNNENGKPAAQVTVTLDEVNNHLVTNARSFAGSS